MEGGWFVCEFFFSSRRRHTRLQGDWSSDVCSSDLSTLFPDGPAVRGDFPPTPRNDQIRYGSTQELRPQLLLLLRTAPRVFGGGNQLLRAPPGVEPHAH